MHAARSATLAVAGALLGTVLVAAPAGADSNPGLVVRGQDNGGEVDRIAARAINAYAGQLARLYRKDRDGLVLLQEQVLNHKGNTRFWIVDRNGRARTKYVVKVRPDDEELYPLRGARKVR